MLRTGQYVPLLTKQAGFIEKHLLGNGMDALQYVRTEIVSIIPKKTQVTTIALVSTASF